jgi:hypothetical protein
MLPLLLLIFSVKSASEVVTRCLSLARNAKQAKKESPQPPLLLLPLLLLLLLVGTEDHHRLSSHIFTKKPKKTTTTKKEENSLLFLIGSSTGTDSEARWRVGATWNQRKQRPGDEG